jgi:hypothetical protein
MNKRQILKRIKETDMNLSLVREPWMAAPEKKKSQYRSLINKLLDERSELMKLRDGNKGK